MPTANLPVLRLRFNKIIGISDTSCFIQKNNFAVLLNQFKRACCIANEKGAIGNIFRIGKDYFLYPGY